MSEKTQYYTQETTGIRFRIGDLYGYPDSLIRGRTGAAYEYALPLLGNDVDAILDFGSGRGHGVKTIKEILSPKSIVSVDKYLPYLNNQSATLTDPNTPSPYQFVNASTDLPFGNDTFDAVTVMHVIEHLKNPNHLMNEIARVLTPDGKVLVATPDKKNLVGKSPYDEHIFTKNELASLLEISGFVADFFYIVPNEKAMRVHERKKWLATHASFTGKIRNHVNPDLWDKSVLRSGISRSPLTIRDFSLSSNYHPNAIDLVALASRAA